MATILEFKRSGQIVSRSQVSSSSQVCGSEALTMASAEILFFPGIRYQRVEEEKNLRRLFGCERCEGGE